MFIFLLQYNILFYAFNKAVSWDFFEKKKKLNNANFAVNWEKNFFTIHNVIII